MDLLVTPQSHAGDTETTTFRAVLDAADEHDLQQREDQALGAAWRRCEAALPKGWRISTVGQNYEGNEWHASVWDRKTGAATTGHGPTPTAALNALADRLEAGHG